MYMTCISPVINVTLSPFFAVAELAREAWSSLKGTTGSGSILGSCGHISSRYKDEGQRKEYVLCCLCFLVDETVYVLCSAEILSSVCHIVKKSSDQKK